METGVNPINKIMNHYCRTIAEQIGKGTLFMLGAYNTMYDNEKNSICFRIKGSNKCNFIRVTYNEGMDDYDMHFSKIVKFEEKNIVDIESIYFDQLHELIREHTGLETRMPNFV